MLGCFLKPWFASLEFISFWCWCVGVPSETLIAYLFFVFYSCQVSFLARPGRQDWARISLSEEEEAAGEKQSELWRLLLHATRGVPPWVGGQIPWIWNTRLGALVRIHGSIYKSLGTYSTSKQHIICFVWVLFVKWKYILFSFLIFCIPYLSFFLPLPIHGSGLTPRGFFTLGQAMTSTSIQDPPSVYFIPLSSPPSPLSMLLVHPTRGFFTLFVDFSPHPRVTESTSV